jgi:hypothetical protein
MRRRERGRERLSFFCILEIVCCIVIEDVFTFSFVTQSLTNSVLAWPHQKFHNYNKLVEELGVEYEPVTLRFFSMDSNGMEAVALVCCKMFF